MQTQPIDPPQRLLMGPWGHHVNAGRQLGELDFGQESVIDLDSVMTDFLGEMVRGQAPTEPVPPAEHAGEITAAIMGLLDKDPMTRLTGPDAARLLRRATRGSVPTPLGQAR